MFVAQGRRASRCSALAPGYHIFAPLALRPTGFRIFVKS
jgi:hypothetical protein